MNGTISQKDDFSIIYSRALHFGVGYGDLCRVSGAAENWEIWSEKLATLARKYERLGENAMIEKKLESAEFFWRKASVYYHFAQVKLQFGKQKCDYQNGCRSNFEKSVSVNGSRLSKIYIPFESEMMPAYLRLSAPTAPCVILIGGLDSAKEVELFTFSQEFSRRGLSVLFFDAPGQGELAGKLSMGEFFDRSFRTVIDYFFLDSQNSPSAFGVFGVSFGGYLACRSLAAESRLKAGVSLGGFFDSDILERLPLPAMDNLKRAFKTNSSDRKDYEKLINLAEVVPPKEGSLFIIHGGKDHLVDQHQVDLLSNWGEIRKKIMILEDSEHVCTDRFNECLPVMADWMVDRLRESDN